MAVRHGRPVGLFRVGCDGKRRNPSRARPAHHEERGRQDALRTGYDRSGTERMIGSVSRTTASPA